jgi:molecular chaperone DnaK
MNEPIFGIDLGTTNSCLAVLEPGGPRVLAVDGEALVPSVVSFPAGATGEAIVGRRARNRLLLEPETTVRGIKRRMGETAPLPVGDRALLPEEIAAEILRHLKVQGGQSYGREVRRAVITVPAYFGDAQRRATLRAGELAGLEVVRLLNEPTAAALLYHRAALRRHGGPAGVRIRHAEAPVERILVYDLGGGTFDVSVVEIGGELDEVRASGGDNRLGGDDFDQLLADHLLARIRERHGRDLADGDRRALARLTDAAERAKIDLSRQPYARVIEEALAPGLHLDLEVERSRFVELIEPLLDRTLAEVDRALEEARLTAEEIDRVVLVGGSTAIPRVVERLAARFPCPVEHAVDPALGVALGAAIAGGLQGGQVFDQILVDVAAHSLGIKTLDSDPLRFGLRADQFSPILRRNSQIPATRSEVYRTLVENQKAVEIEVYQGEDPRCSRNTPIGAFVFALAPAPRHSPVVVELSYDLDGIIHVVVEQKGAGRRQEVTMATGRSGGDLAAADESDDEADGEAGGRRAVDNYILRKARALAGSLPAGELGTRLEQAALAYEEALDLDEDVDLAEDELLLLLEEAEELAGAQGDDDFENAELGRQIAGTAGATGTTGAIGSNVEEAPAHREP